MRIKTLMSKRETMKGYGEDGEEGLWEERKKEVKWLARGHVLQHFRAGSWSDFLTNCPTQLPPLK